MERLIQIQNNAKSLTPRRVTSDLFRFIKTIEDEIFDLNINQLYKAEDADGNDLVNKDEHFSGVYQPLTVAFAAEENPILPKKVGGLYNFGWDGEFLKGFEMVLFPDFVEIFSTGEGTGKKKAFFDGYQSLYGLSPKSISIIIEKRLLPFIKTYYAKNLLK